jgi:transcriptional regulator with XRE-family HTH domain
MDGDVGPRLRTVRAKMGLSQRSLARRAGVPSSTVSLIEGGRTNPSIGSLKRLLDAAGLSLAEFFSFDMVTEQQIFFRQDELAEISSGDVSYRQVGAGAGISTLQILHETYQPGSDSGRVMLTHDGEEGGIVIQGRLEVTVGQQTRVLKAGEAYLFQSITPHRFRNVGDGICVVVSACTPPTF